MKRLSAALIAMASMTLAMAQKPDTYTNPVIPGFYPDPSTIRVDDDYYTINSTFNSTSDETFESNSTTV